MSIHPLSVVSPYAEIGTDVRIGPFSVVEAGVVLGDGCNLASRVTVRSGTVLGRDNLVLEGTVLGGMPQHVHMPEYPGVVTIGDGNVIRENVTVHRAMNAGNVTQIGSRCLLMVGSHVAHDCSVGDGVILTNGSMLGGHVTVDDKAYISGGVAVHQFCRIGRLAMVGGLARVTRDVPPFVTVDGGTTMIVGLNKVGLRRAGFSPQDLMQLKAAYRTIYRSGLTWEETLEVLRAQFTDGPAAEFLPFLTASKRGFVQERRTPPGAIVRLLRDDDEDAATTLAEADKKVG
ncbi:MAG TPA: acyl-ACP--UDP-N-acetylglucosamine O-acyltransferase [Lacipirellulaceae bacterium]|nr:acyl-ACP--UDP-N-acetylglucosamine O-acyltransferase [Lacipirellulaceae bacterium]